jgi:cephalosporin hydroxylase
MESPDQLFNSNFYNSGKWNDTTWLGIQTLKVPTDLWIYQELITAIRPSLIVECGTYRGGSALFLASICDLINWGQVATIDLVEYPDRPQHPRITYIMGSTIAAQTVATVRDMLSGESICMVILDSDHSRDHVLAEMQLYGPLVSEGCYLIVEDTNVNGHPVLPEFGPGPMEAVEEFLQIHPEFEVDLSCERFGLTFNPRGYLRRRLYNLGCDTAAREPNRQTQVQLDERTKWVVAAAKQVRERDKIIRDLQKQVGEQTNWALATAEQVRERDDMIRDLQKQLDEQTNWALASAEHVRQRDDMIRGLQKQLDEQTNWALVTAEQVRQRDDIIRGLQRNE